MELEPHAATPAPQKPAASAAGAAEQPPHATQAAPTASIDALDFTITIPQAQALFDQHSRKVPGDRTLQTYCQSGKLIGRKITHLNAEGTTVSEWMINERSLLTYIRSQPVLKNEPSELSDAGAAEPTVAAPHAPQKPAASAAGAAEQPPHATQAAQKSAGETRLELSMTERYIERVEDENKFLRGQIETKDMQLATANRQITDLLDSSRNQIGFMDKLGGLITSFSNRLLAAPQQSDTSRPTP